MTKLWRLVTYILHLVLQLILWYNLPHLQCIQYTCIIRSLIPPSSFMLKFIGKAGLSINFEADCKNCKGGS